MCGIAGFISKNKNKKHELLKMMKKIKHRGPDDNGVFIDDHIALGHLRLSILDIENGRQPMYKNNLILCYNGEIYNYLDLKKDLELKGYKFKTNCDTEVLLYGYEYYKEKILKKLRGMFAFVIWDKEKKELICARDFFGIKPLYYYKKNGTFIFSSEIKAILVNSEFKKEFNEDILPNYLRFGFIPNEETFFKNVYSLKPGHYLKYKVKTNTIKIIKYFEIKFKEKLKTVEEFSKYINKNMVDSIVKHKISDVEVGAFLSSGIDSAYIVGLSKPKKTFTIGYKNKYFNEINEAKSYAKKCNIENICKIVTKKEYFKNLKKVLYYMDEPIVDPSIVSLYLISKTAKKHVKVILSGEGADELFGGYNYYNTFLTYKFYEKIPFVIRNIIAKICKNLPNIKGINFLIRRGENLKDNYISVNRIFNDKEGLNILSKKYNINYKDITNSVYSRLNGISDVSKMQMIDLNFWFVKDILLKADKLSMANSIELRVPFVDKEVYNIARTLPEYAKVNKELTKVALRHACKKVIGERKSNYIKLGFPVPIKEWIKDDDVYNKIYLEFNSSNSKKFFKFNKLINLLNRAKKGSQNTYKKVLAIYFFLIWYRIFFPEN